MEKSGAAGKSGANAPVGFHTSIGQPITNTVFYRHSLTPSTAHAVTFPDAARNGKIKLFKFNELK
ncbi:hypothetical protein [Pectobacterium aquaticum]|uniref:hypothetical protein n=1 Tax=Pectobacterium aquaticum TaxID=2204145 RepID=UPI001675014C|nr:hypothetical protein [Pectobacterium aquaticum]